MTTKKASSKPKAKRARTTGKKTTKIAQHHRNKNNLTDQEQEFADAILTNKESRNATEIMMQLNPQLQRQSARVKASLLMRDERVKEYMDKMRERVEKRTEYDLIKWRADVLELVDIAMGRKGRPKPLPVNVDDKKPVDTIKVQYVDVREFEGSVAKGALELLAKQMKLLTDKMDLGLEDVLKEIFGKVRPTLGPPSMRDGNDN